jgi:hypothetical protein
LVLKVCAHFFMCAPNFKGYMYVRIMKQFTLILYV